MSMKVRFFNITDAHTAQRRLACCRVDRELTLLNAEARLAPRPRLHVLHLHEHQIWVLLLLLHMHRERRHVRHRCTADTEVILNMELGMTDRK